MSNLIFHNDDREFTRAAIEAALDYIDPSRLSPEIQESLPLPDNDSYPRLEKIFNFYIDRRQPLC